MPCIDLFWFHTCSECCRCHREDLILQGTIFTIGQHRHVILTNEQHHCLRLTRYWICYLSSSFGRCFSICFEICKTTGVLLVTTGIFCSTGSESAAVGALNGRNQGVPTMPTKKPVTAVCSILLFLVDGIRDHVSDYEKRQRVQCVLRCGRCFSASRCHFFW